MSKNSLRFRLLALAVPAFASVLFIERASTMEIPFAALLLTASAWMIVVALLARPEAVRNGTLLCSSVLFGLAVIETTLYFVARSQIIIVRTTPAPWRLNKRDIGSMPFPNSRTEFREFLDGRLISRVTYTIEANGLREIPSSVQGRPHKVAFFGCSFMFGHGVENDQTLPYYFVQDSAGAFEGFNFAGEGWGPHQMLREIENGFVRRVSGTPDLAIYEVIPDHLRRVAGRAPWEDGPKYELCRGDEACYSGAFHSFYYNACRRWLGRSWTVKFLENHFARLSRPSDLPLFLAVLTRTRSLLAENGTRFIIVLWDQNELANTMLKALKANQFDVVALSSIIPDNDLRKRHLTQLDQHPSPETNEAIAMYLWRNVGERSLAH
jgi:hypothetical protein